MKTKTERLLVAFTEGKTLTAKQIVSRYNLASESSARKIVSNLKADGYDVRLLRKAGYPSRYVMFS